MEHLGQFIVNHWALWSAFLVVLFLIFITEWVAQKKKAKEISPQSTVTLMNNNEAVIIDLRDKDSFKKGHIIDAIQAKADDFEQPKMHQYKNKTIILVCEKGVQSPEVAAKLQTQGYRPMVLAGGINAWQAADLPLVKKG